MSLYTVELQIVLLQTVLPQNDYYNDWEDENNHSDENNDHEDSNEEAADDDVDERVECVDDIDDRHEENDYNVDDADNTLGYQWKYIGELHKCGC